ncbi:MAG: hypothetical protein WBW01_18430 [Terriglobales bacterium]
MSQVDDSKVVRGKALKIMDLTPNFSLWRALAGVLTGVFVGHLLSFIVKERVKSLRPEMRASLETGAVRGIFAPIGEQVCDGSYMAFVMNKVNGPGQATLGRGTLPSVRLGTSSDCPLSIFVVWHENFWDYDLSKLVFIVLDCVGDNSLEYFRLYGSHGNSGFSLDNPFISVRSHNLA